LFALARAAARWGMQRCGCLRPSLRPGWVPSTCGACETRRRGVRTLAAPPSASIMSSPGPPPPPPGVPLCPAAAWHDSHTAPLTPRRAPTRPQALDRWEERLEALFEGRPYDMLDAALTDTIAREAHAALIMGTWAPGSKSLGGAPARTACATGVLLWTCPLARPPPTDTPYTWAPPCPLGPRPHRTPPHPTRTVPLPPTLHPQSSPWTSSRSAT
jgi:hypothetical protein